MANVINFNDDENKDKPSGQSSAVSGAISPFVSGGTPAPQQAPQQPAQQNKAASSGQFTNIQKYLNANRGAGEQIAGQVQNKMNKNLQPGIKNQQDEASKVAAGVAAANTTLDRGQGYQNELSAPGKVASLVKPPTPVPTGSVAQSVTDQSGFGKDTSSGPAMSLSQVQEKMSPGGIPVNSPLVPEAQSQAAPAVAEPQLFNPESFTNDTNKLTDFTKIRLGQGVDEQALKAQAEGSQNLAGASETQAKDLFGRTRSAVGRTGLIGETFNRPNYTQGQQRLDNLFLTGAGKKGINAIQDTAKTNVGQASDRLANSGKDVATVGDVGTREQTLQKGLQDRANSLETGYVDSLESLVPELNNMRQSERDRYQKNFNILTGKAQGTIDQDIFDDLKLRTNEHSFNVLNDPNLTMRQVVNVSDQNAQSYRDVARQGDVDYYKKLAQLSKGTLNGKGEFVNATDDQLALTKASDMAKAAAAKTGDGSLRGKLDTALSDFLTKAKSANITGIGTDTGTSSMFGPGGTAAAQTQLNLADYLNRSGQGAQLQAFNSGNNGDAKGQALAASNAMFSVGAIPGVGNLINGISGADSGSTAAASYRAKNALIGNLNAYLTNAGYGNFITGTGVKDTSDLMNKNAALEQDRLDIATRNRYNTLGLNDSQLSELFHGGTQEGRAAFNSGIMNETSLPALLQSADQGNMSDAGRAQLAALQQKYNMSIGDLQSLQYQAGVYADQRNNNTSGLKSEQARLQAEYNEKMAGEDAAKRTYQQEMNKRLGMDANATNGPLLSDLNLFKKNV